MTVKQRDAPSHQPSIAPSRSSDVRVTSRSASAELAHACSVTSLSHESAHFRSLPGPKVGTPKHWTTPVCVSSAGRLLRARPAISGRAPGGRGRRDARRSTSPPLPSQARSSPDMSTTRLSASGRSPSLDHDCDGEKGRKHGPRWAIFRASGASYRPLDRARAGEDAAGAQAGRARCDDARQWFRRGPAPLTGPRVEAVSRRSTECPLFVPGDTERGHSLATAAVTAPPGPPRPRTRTRRQRHRWPSRRTAECRTRAPGRLWVP